MDKATKEADTKDLEEKILILESMRADSYGQQSLDLYRRIALFKHQLYMLSLRD